VVILGTEGKNEFFDFQGDGLDFGDRLNAGGPLRNEDGTERVVKGRQEVEAEHPCQRPNGQAVHGHLHRAGPEAVAGMAS
jgi:hypothetical protein